MEPEKLLPEGELGIEVNALPVLKTPVDRADIIAKSTVPAPTLSGVPSPAQQQWGVVISIVIIVLMVIIGAFYAWGERIAENQIPAGAITQ